MWFIGCDVGVVGILERVWQLDHAPVLDDGADGRMDGADERRSAGRLGGLGQRVTRCAEKQAEDCAEGGVSASGAPSGCRRIATDWNRFQLTGGL